MKIKKENITEVSIWLARYKKIATKKENQEARIAKGVEAIKEMKLEMNEIENKLKEFGVEIVKEGETFGKPEDKANV